MGIVARATSLAARYSIRTVIIAGFGIVIALGIAIIVLTAWAQGHAVAALDRLITVENHISDLALKSSSALIRARRNEKDYLLNYRDFGHTEAKSRYITRVLTDLAEIRAAMETIRTLTDNAEIGDQTRSVEKALDDYQTRLLALVDKYGEVGFFGSGLEGAFREKARAIEGIVADAADEALMSGLLSLRRREKDFILRGLDADAERFAQEVDRFRSALTASRLPKPQRERMATLLTAYSAGFTSYVRAVNELRTIKAGYLRSIQTVEPILERLYLESDTRIALTRTKLRTTEKIIGPARIVIGFVTVAFMFGIAAVVSGAISRSVDESRTFAAEIASGNFGKRLPAGGSTEFSVLTAALNTMAASLEEAHDARQRWTEELQRSEERFRHVFEEGPLGMLIFDDRGTILKANRVICTVLEYQEEELVGTPLAVIFPREERANGFAPLQGILGGDPAQFSIDCRLGKRGGDILWAQITATALRYGAGAAPYGLAMIDDVSERKRLEEQLRHSQKMEALGTLTGGIAHEFNNILQSIIGYGEFLDDEMAPDSPLRPYVDVIRSSSRRAANLTHGLLAYSRKQILHRRLIPLNDILGKVDTFLSRFIGEDISLTVGRTDDDLRVNVDSSQIEQALINLATNAKDAMPAGGTLNIQAAERTIDEEFVRANGYGEPGTYVLITVRDTGSGVDQETREKMFEPFFTTKEVGKGTGLGLSVVYGIVKAHNGFIDVMSEPGQGTAICLYLPAFRVESEDTEAADDMAVPGGSETVLIAEDDAEVRQLIAAVLKRHGYTVIEAVDGEDAVRLATANRERIQLVVCDLVMPRMNGREAFGEIRRMNPAIRGLFVSGYTDDIIHEKGMLEEGYSFVAKPIAPRELLARVREVLGG